MIKFFKRTAFLLVLFPICSLAQNLHPAKFNWLDFMARQSLRWDSISPNYYTGMILGNGLLGTNIYQENDYAIRFDIGRTDVVDQRENLNKGYS